ncbi:hypothetical protein F4821DRAFT_229462 [Hypoxylon rubiginosum]|uniref:Uncharacterized protein n=1 Tax=Hypoxylon rubiginosum TaxID=110542 RepID=A0ACC0DBW7_9PEZI|nr:hypothetical protein F4821DRAFT_229462 [Hypoxylon rubiginosum]
MSKNGSVVQDTSLPLSQIRSKNSASIVESLLEIQKHAVTRENWLKSLECLYLAQDHEERSVKRRRVSGGSVAAGSSELLRRRYLDPVSDAEGQRDYIAVSYTWQASEQEEEAEEEAVGHYLIESRRTGEPPMASDVRDVVWTRVLNFADHVGCQNIWIDRECVDQEDEAEQEAAIQSMHLVYSLSKRPIALLTREIETLEDLDLLTNLLCGDVGPGDEAATLDLLDDITSNLWWTRAWTFQEDYRASTRMTLLIPHHRNLEVNKQTTVDDAGRFLLGNVEGEVCIDSREFKRRATEFCLAYRKNPEARDVCDKILKTAAQYNILLREGSPSSIKSISRSMSPTIISDILSRGITLESDRLAIMANCCGYGIRLDTNALNSSGSSLSLSILALYLLNGEIMENGRDKTTTSRGTLLDDRIHEYLSRQSLSSFRPPVDEGLLTFIKSCRFSEPRLRADGTATAGHLWRLGKAIRRKPMKRDKYGTLPPLDVFATDLFYQNRGTPDLDFASRLLAWSREYSSSAAPSQSGRDRDRGGRRNPRRWGWRQWMTDEVEEALMEGKTLRLGRLVHPRYRGGEDAAYRAVFVGDADDESWGDDDDESYAFTCVQKAKGGEMLGDASYKHVSLEVDAEFPERAPPRLYIRRWLNGLCFFDGQPQRDVLFPWPSALLEKQDLPAQ